MDVIAFADKERMRLNANRYVEIAGGATHTARIAFARHAQPGTRLSARRNPHLDSFRRGKPPVAVARGTDVAQSSFPIATRTGQAELHSARHLRHVAGSIAFRTHRRRTTHRAASPAGLAGLLAGNI